MRAQYQTLFQTKIHTFRSHSAAGITLLVLLGLLFGPLGASADSTSGLTDSLTSTMNLTSAAIEPPAEDRLWLTLEDYRHVPVQTGRAWNDLLQHLRTGFALEPVMNRRVEAELKWYTRHPDYLERVFNRAQRYLPHITATLEERGLPLELALLPIVESAYDPFAYSHGRAAGLWQIIPGTGRRFGLAQNWWYDGRRDIVDSTRAALDYLTYLHEMMDGDWQLAVASYNSGEGNVLRAVKRNRSKGLPTDFWNLKLSRETSAYVPRLLALVHIVRDPAAYGLSLPEIVNEPQFDVVDIDSQLDLALAAELAGIDLDTLYGFNAGSQSLVDRPGRPASPDPARRARGGIPRGAGPGAGVGARALEAAQGRERRDHLRDRRGLRHDAEGRARGEQSARQHDPRGQLSDDPGRDRAADGVREQRRRTPQSHPEPAARGQPRRSHRRAG